MLKFFQQKRSSKVVLIFEDNSERIKRFENVLVKIAADIEVTFWRSARKL